MKALPKALLLTCGLTCSHSLWALADTAQVEFNKALSLAKSRHIKPALVILKQLVESDPDNMAYLHHYYQILGWAKEDNLIMDMEVQLFIKSSTPIYVLETIARSARNTRNIDESIEFYHSLLAREPERLSAALGLAMGYSDSGRAEQALKILLPLAEQQPDHPEILSALAYAYEQNRNHYFKALACYEKLLILKPEHKDTLRRKIMLLDKLTPTLAYRMAQNHPDLFKANEWNRIRWDNAAVRTRWAETAFEADWEGDAQRFKELDHAIETLETNLAQTQNKTGDAVIWARRARYDLIIALRDRFRMQEVVEHVRTFQEEPSRIPLSVRIAAGDAYLYLEQPEHAVQWYKSALAQNPDDWKIQLSLFYTYFELEQHDKAFELIDSKINQHPDIRDNKFIGPKRVSSIGGRTKLDIDITAAMAHAYADQLVPAQARLQRLHEQAPHNLNIQSSLASVYYWRGWPRTAQTEYEIGLNHDPRHVGLSLGLARNKLELKHYPEAEQAIDDLVQRYPENKHIQNLNQRWQFHNRPELNFWVNGSDSSGGPKGSSIISLEGYLYSAPIKYNYRVFAHSYWSRAEFIEGRGTTTRNGIGVEYTRPDWRLIGEVDHVRYANDKIGFKLSGSYDWNDFWRTSLDLESVSADTPLRAMKNDITAKSISATINYRLSERRSFALNGSFLDFSGGNLSKNNQRYSIGSSWYERWISNPKYKLSTFASIFYSQNNKKGVPYYNPDSDLSLDLTVEQDWLTYRHYDFTFNQILALSIGDYWQQGFGNAIVGSVRYEHRLMPSPGIELNYGTKYSQARYDGEREREWLFYLNANWRF